MPAIRSRQTVVANGNSKHCDNNLDAEALVSKKLQFLEGDEPQKANGISKGTTTFAPQQTGISDDEEEVFLDTCALGAHAKRKLAENGEPVVVVFDGQNNTSISQTAKDQFAAALLRLQANLDDSTKRLFSVESKLDELEKQHQQQKQSQRAVSRSQNAVAKSGGWTSSQNTRTLLYLGWPILVFFAIRAFERRAIVGSNKLGA